MTSFSSPGDACRVSGAAAFFATLQSLVIPVLPTIEHALHTSQTNVTWVLTTYLLSASIFTPILGRLGGMSGKKRMFVAGGTRWIPARRRRYVADNDDRRAGHSGDRRRCPAADSDGFPGTAAPTGSRG